MNPDERITELKRRADAGENVLRLTQEVLLRSKLEAKRIKQRCREIKEDVATINQKTSKGIGKTL